MPSYIGLVSAEPRFGVRCWLRRHHRALYAVPETHLRVPFCATCAAVGEGTEPERREKSQAEWDNDYQDAMQARDWQTCDYLLAEREGLSWWPVGEDTE